MTTKAEADARATLEAVARITDREPADVLADLIQGARAGQCSTRIRQENSHERAPRVEVHVVKLRRRRP